MHLDKFFGLAARHHHNYRRFTVLFRCSHAAHRTDDYQGKIDTITWNPEKFRKGLYTLRNGKRHYASGAPGHDRTVPAHRTNYTLLIHL